MNHKHIYRLTVIPAIFMGVLAMAAQDPGPFTSGTGEPNDPYQIETTQQLLAMSGDSDLLDKHFILNNDLDMDPNGPSGQIAINSVIGSEESPFWGEFDGNHHVISNLTIQCENDEGCGLTGYLKGVVRNLTLENIDITNATQSGAISGYNAGIIKNCHATGRIMGTRGLGGLVGSNRGVVSHCTTHVTVTGSSSGVGGLVGNNGQTISHCSSGGTVTGLTGVGGLVGYNGSNIIESDSDCNTIGDKNVGGLVGSQNIDGLILKCQTHGSVRGNTNVGGFIGVLYDSPFGQLYLLKNSSFSSVVADQVAGGFIGDIRLSGIKMSECCALGEVKANIAGGFFGSAIFYSHGQEPYSLTDCYAANRVSAIHELPNPQDTNELALGGFVGSLKSDPKHLHYLSACFWDKDLSGQSEGIHISNATSSPLDMSQIGLQGRTTEQMMDPNTFKQSGWDYEITWTQTPGQSYPGLRCITTPYAAKGGKQ